ncbi:MAG: hypothetical protein HQK84_09775 [Nitrospinae bacterium]|nr:hypothetical protein [Nitrospinota bacterium]
MPTNHPVTFELKNPKGQLVKRIVTKESLNGFYSFHVKTDEKAITGNYTAKIKAGGAVFQKTLKVETVLPNRLKILFDVGSDQIDKNDKDIKGHLDVKWLHGAVAKNLKADVNVTLTPAKTLFNKYSDYEFDDEGVPYKSEQFTVFNKNLDKKGLADFPLIIKSNQFSPGILKANFHCRVFEQGGAFSVDKFSIPYHPYKTYTGIRLPKGDEKRGMLLTDQSHEVKLVTVNQKGEPVSGKKLRVSLYKLEWKWWWEKSNETGVGYNSRYLKNPLIEEEIETVNGEGSFKIRVNYPDWGRYLVRACEKDGHCSGKVVYIDWPGYAGRDRGENSGGAATLAFTSDKESYQVGEEVTVTIPTGNKGRALITIESGSKVLESNWVETVSGETQFSFTAKKSMVPNIYVNVTLLQPHAQTANDLPIRLYGVLPIMVEDIDSRLNPEIIMPDVLKPEEEVHIQVKEANNKPMTYTLAMVDDGLLDLTRFKTPAPWEYFNAKEALKIKTWDIYDEVLGAFGDALKTILSVGGGEDLQSVEESKTNRFKPVVKFVGPFYLEAGETANHHLKLPQYIGSVRTMVVAAQKGAYGSVEKTTPVKKPLMVLGTLPRVAGTSEKINFPVTLFALDEKIKEVSVAIDTDKYIKVSGEKEKTITFSEIGEQIVTFSLDVDTISGTSTIKVVANSDDDSSEYTTDLIVHNQNPPMVKVTSAMIEAGKEMVSEVNLFGVKGSNKATLEISSIPPLNLGKRLNYVIKYPHGCLEQTVSSVFPQLFLTDLLELTEERKEEIDKNIRAALTKLSGFQLSSGGLSSWPGNTETDEWATNYAGHFVLEAKKLGYLPPDSFIKNWLKDLQQRANNWTNNSELVQAYRIYLMALANRPLLGVMNRFRESEPKNITAQWLLAASYFISGQPEIALKIAEELPVEIKEQENYEGSYGSVVRDKAMILEAMSVMGLHKKARTLIDEISDKLNSEDWLSTQTTAFSLLAMGKTAKLSGGKLNVNYLFGEKKWNVVKSGKPIVEIDLPLHEENPTPLTVQNHNDGPIYLNLAVKGTPPAGKEESFNENLELKVTYLNLNGKEIDPSEIRQGEDFYASVAVKNITKKTYNDMALTQIFPSGWEITESLNKNTGKWSKPTYQDIRDDRVYRYFNLKPHEELTFRVNLHAAYRGTYYLPAVVAELMYDNSARAVIKGQWVKVQKKEFKENNMSSKEPVSTSINENVQKEEDESPLPQ